MSVGSAVTSHSHVMVSLNGIFEDASIVKKLVSRSMNLVLKRVHLRDG